MRGNLLFSNIKDHDNGSVNHSGKSSEIFATKKSVRVSHFSFVSFLPRLKLERTVQNITVLKSKELLK